MKWPSSLVHSARRYVHPFTAEAFLLPCGSRLLATVLSVHASDPTGLAVVCFCWTECLLVALYYVKLKCKGGSKDAAFVQGSAQKRRDGMTKPRGKGVENGVLGQKESFGWKKICVAPLECCLSEPLRKPWVDQSGRGCQVL